MTDRVTSSSDIINTNSTMAEAGLLPKCDPEENNFRIKDYFTDLESYFVALNIANDGKNKAFCN